MTTYKIVRFYQDDRQSKVIRTGLTLEQAKLHCNNPETRGAGWFDGFEAEKQKTTRWEAAQ